MNRGRSFLYSTGFYGAGLAAAGLTAFGAIAQEAGGNVITFGLEQQLQASDNFELSNDASAQSGARAVTNLSAGISSITDSTEVSLTGTGRLEFGSGQNVADGFTDPSVAFNVATQNRSTRLAFGANYTENDVSNVGFVAFAPLTGTDLLLQQFGFEPEREELLIGDGTRQRTNLSASIEIGRDAPLGLTLSSDYNHLDYKNTADPDLVETERLSFTAAVRARLSDVATLRFGASLNTSEAQDSFNTRRNDLRYFANAEYQIREDLAASARISYSDNETERTGFAVQNTDGIGLGFGLTKSLIRGTIGFDADTSVSGTARRTTFRLTRAMDLRDGALSMSLGVVKVPSASAEPTLNLQYTKNLQRGEMTLGLSQSVGTNDDSDTILNTVLQAGYNAAINDVSSWGANLGLRESSTLNGGVDDTQRVDLSLNYRHKLTRDWDLNAGYTHSKASQTGENDRSSNTVNLGLSRAWEFRR